MKERGKECKNDEESDSSYHTEPYHDEEKGIYLCSFAISSNSICYKIGQLSTDCVRASYYWVNEPMNPSFIDPPSTDHGIHYIYILLYALYALYILYILIDAATTSAELAANQRNNGIHYIYILLYAL